MKESININLFAKTGVMNFEDGMKKKLPREILTNGNFVAHLHLHLQLLLLGGKLRKKIHYFRNSFVFLLDNLKSKTILLFFLSKNSEYHFCLVAWLLWKTHFSSFYPLDYPWQFSCEKTLLRAWRLHSIFCTNSCHFWCNFQKYLEGLFFFLRLWIKLLILLLCFEACTNMLPVPPPSLAFS